MGQTYFIVNVEKKQYFLPFFNEQVQSGKFKELWSSENIARALAVLLAVGNAGAGGDLNVEDPLLGAWAGDPVAVLGEYAEFRGLAVDQIEGDAGWRDIGDDLQEIIEIQEKFETARYEFADYLVEEVPGLGSGSAAFASLTVEEAQRLFLLDAGDVQKYLRISEWRGSGGRVPDGVPVTPADLAITASLRKFGTLANLRAKRAETAMTPAQKKERKRQLEETFAPQFAQMDRARELLEKAIAESKKDTIRSKKFDKESAGALQRIISSLRKMGREKPVDFADTVLDLHRQLSKIPGRPRGRFDGDPNFDVDPNLDFNEARKLIRQTVLDTNSALRRAADELQTLVTVDLAFVAEARGAAVKIRSVIGDVNILVHDLNFMDATGWNPGTNMDYVRRRLKESMEEMEKMEPKRDVGQTPEVSLADLRARFAAMDGVVENLIAVLRAAEEQRAPVPRADKKRRVECELCGAEAANQCSGCSQVAYCSADCQREHWSSGHRNVCSQK